MEILNPLVVNCEILLEAFITVDDLERPTFRENSGSRGRLVLSVLLVLQIELKHCLTVFIYLFCLFFFLKGGRCNCNDVCWLLFETKTDVSFFMVVDLVRVSLSLNCSVTTLFFNFNRSLEPASENSKVDRVCDALRLTLETAGHNRFVKTEFHR